MAQAEPFEVAIPQADLDDMLGRLRATRWAHEFGNEAGLYGVRRPWLQDIVEHWTTDYDWRAQEAQINAFPQYMAVVDGVPIHFIHAKGKGSDPKPIILTHGWPWTFWDWKDVIGPLTDPAAHGAEGAQSFDVVIPSLPGAGFSMPLTTTGLGARRIAELWDTLMTGVLGYERYGAGGGDWGSIITGEIGHGFSDHLIGVWLTLPYVPGVNLRLLDENAYADDEGWMWERMLEARPTIMAHRTVNEIEPQTIAYGLADSPAGTAAFILGRRADWSDHDGDVFEIFDRDFLCTTASIYWLTGSIASSLRIYSEHFRGGSPPGPRHDREQAIDCPTGFCTFPKELLLLPKAWGERVTNMHRWALPPRGGHFSASEQPETVVSELRAFYEELT